MLARRTALTLPVQTGHGAAHAMLRHFALYCVTWLGQSVLIRRGEPALILIVLGLLGAMGLIFCSAFFRTYQRRASNVVLGEEDIAFRSGPLDGLSLPWSLVDSEHLSLESAHGRRGESVCRLNGPGWSGLVVARTASRTELQSLEALLRTLQTWDRDRSPSVDVTANADIVGCRDCGAALPLSGDRSVRCEHCDLTQELPAQVTERLAAHHQARTASRLSDGLARRLLRQPSPRLVNGVLIGCWGALFIGIPAAFIWGRDWSLMATLGLSLWLMATLGVLLAERRAVGLLVGEYAALMPNPNEDAYRCRGCGAPLATTQDDSLLVMCHYCLSVNLIGLDFRSVAQRSGKQLQSLTILLQRRSQARATVWASLMLCIAFSGLAIRSYASGNEDDPARDWLSWFSVDGSVENRRIDNGKNVVPRCAAYQPSVTSAVLQLEPMLLSTKRLREPALVRGGESLVFQSTYDGNDASYSQLFELCLTERARARLVTQTATAAETPAALDGSSFLFLADDRRTLQLSRFVRGAPPELVHASKTRIYSYSIHPDGESFVVSTILPHRPDLTVLVYSRDGKQLGEMDGEEAAFSGDGRYLALIRHQRDRRVFQLVRGPGRPWGNGDAEVLWESSDAIQGPISWSPDGQWILYHKPVPSRLHVYSTKTRRRYRLTHDGTSALDARWGTDGWIYFSSSDDDCPHNLWRLRLREESAAGEPEP